MLPAVQRLPVGVLVPVLNCRDDLERHLAVMERWIDLVDEIVVVDSQSSDGSLEFLKDNLDHPKITFVDHPPGLYPAWNHGIGLLSSKYFFVSTTCDGMERSGLERMYETVVSMDADVLIGVPDLVDGRGQPKGKRWPLHDFVDSNGISEACLIDPWDWLAWASMFLPATLMGSSASNLYRTQFMQDRPFSSEYSRMGDSAWAIEHAFSGRIGIEPRAASFFWVHGAPEGIHEQYAQTIQSFVDLLGRVIARQRDRGDRGPLEVQEVLQEFEDHKEALVEYFMLAADYQMLKRSGSIWDRARAFRIRMRRRKFHQWRKRFRERGQALLSK